jgi:acetone carboxylase alpha subunit
MGYEMIVASRGTPNWGFMTVTSGSKFSSVPGMFGGYGCPVYPLAIVKGINIYDVIKEDPTQFDLSIERVMNEQPFAGGDYQSAHMGLQFDVAKEGELYMIAQGAGGGYGDVLERDPELVVTDLELDRISAQIATEMYGVVWEPSTFVVHEEETRQLRADMRRARISRGTPYKEFLKKFVTEGPPADLLYFGSWGQEDDEELIATHWGGLEPERVKGKLEELPLIMIPDRRVLKISRLESRVRELEQKYGEAVIHKS